MKRWSNRFASLSLLILLAACHSTPREDSQAPALYVAKSADDGTVNARIAVASSAASGTTANAAVANPPAANAPAGSNPAPGNAPAPVSAAAITPPVPAQAAQQYADALRLMKAGRGTDAELGFKQLAATYPDFAGPQLNLGLLYLQGSRLPEAEAAFKAVLEHNPSNAIAGNELGIVERRLGKFTEAEAAYRRTIAAEPDYAPAYLNLGVLYDLYLAEPQKALEQFEHYIQLTGENKQVAGWVVELRKRVGVPAPTAKKEPE